MPVDLRTHANAAGKGGGSFRVVRGYHTEGTLRYGKGEIVESESDLEAKFPNKFKREEGGGEVQKGKAQKGKAQRASADDEEEDEDQSEAAQNERKAGAPRATDESRRAAERRPGHDRALGAKKIPDTEHEAEELEEEDEDLKSQRANDDEEQEEELEDVTSEFGAKAKKANAVVKTDGDSYFVFSADDEDKHIGKKGGYSTKKETNELLASKAK